MLRREGWMINQKRTRRIYRELGLELRNKTPKSRVKPKLREDRSVAVAANETWAMDFVHDQLATGRKLRVLTVVDTFSRFSAVLDARFSYRGEDVATLDRVCTEVGFPRTIRVDQGSEFDLPRPGPLGLPARRDARLLPTRQADRQRLPRCPGKLEAWRRYYNEDRPHGAIGYKPRSPS
jgi:putative transposase